MKFLDNYKKYKQKYSIFEGTVKSLIPIMQEFFLVGRKYNDLTDQQKIELQNTIDGQCKYIESLVNDITTNAQYKSWIFDILKNEDKDINEDFNVIKDAIKDFEKICRRSDLTPEQKNIQNYKHFQDLQQFLLEFQNAHKQNNNIYSCFKKLYNNSEYTIYFVNKDQYQEFNQVFGGKKFWNTGWCVAKNEMYFDYYIWNDSDRFNGYMVWITNEDNKPFALLHYGSGQFKDPSDKPITSKSPSIIDGLIHISDNINDYYHEINNPTHDLSKYSYLIWSKKSPNNTPINKVQYIAELIGGDYDESTNTLDCKHNKIKFHNKWLNEGTFNFKLKNLPTDCSNMFAGCDQLVYLPEYFKLEEGITNCKEMFYDCCNLLYLPNDFSLPSTVNDIKSMFNNCYKLTHLPNNFIIPNNVKNCYDVFGYCFSLFKLPDNFTIPNGVIDCSWMFHKCKSLKQLPNNFRIPDSVINTRRMFNMCVDLEKLPDGITMPKNIECCEYMFEGCKSLQTYPKSFNYKLIYI